MEFRILGSFEVVASAGVLDLRGAKRRGLLACLVVHAGQPMSTDRLVEELWGAGGSDGAVRTVQTYVSQLRKLLHDEAASLVTRPGGYVLEVDPTAVDAYRFEQGVTAAGAEPDPTRRLAALDGTLKLWRGPPLGEFAGAGWADREATRLEALGLQALQRRYDTLLELDRAGEAVAELETLVGAHPLDERLWAQLMLALYRSGRQADALGAYQQARRHLVDELGIEPGLELAQLEHRILDHDPTLVTPPRPPTAVDVHHWQASGTTDDWYPRTFLLTDIVDSVSLWERDPAGMSEAVARHAAIIQDSVRASRGELVRTKGEGDSTFSVFVHPSDALAAAAAIQELVASEPWPSRAPLRVRTGVHTGDSEPRDGDWYGPAVNRAARLRALADGGQTLLSGVTAGLVADQMPDSVRLLYRGRRVLRGIERPEEVWELVAAHDPRLAAPTSAKMDRLPAALTRFVGRTADFDQLAKLIETERLVTLTGPGGSGKTRLAMELARHATGRGNVVWLAELASLRDGGLVAQAVATAAAVETGPDPLDDLLAQPEALAGLLVLDNCEHLLDDCVALTERLLAVAPDLRVLATSREPMGLPGEREWPVRSLHVPDESQRDRDQLGRVESVQLLLDRARAVRPDLEVGDDDVASVVHICRTLDGIPLAIELAAGRLRSLTFAGLAERLGGQLDLLARHRSAGRDDARHQTLRLTLDWSYDLLTNQQRTLARQLSVFAGGFRLDAVEAVCGGELDVLDGIDELVAKSLVTFDGTTARYRLLEPLRQYLADRLDETGETDAVQRAHAEWVAGLCDRLGARLYEVQKACSLRLREEAANIELALRWAHKHGHAMAIRIVGALGPFWFFYDPATGRRWCDAVIEPAAGVAPLSRARALLSAGMIAQNHQAWNRSITRLREALAIYRVEGAAAGHAAALHWLGRALANWSDPDHGEDHALEATQCFEESLQLFTRLGDRVGAGWCRILLTALAFWNDDLDRAEHLATQVVQDCSPAGVRHPLGQALSSLAYVARRRDDNDAAVEFLHDAVALYRDLDDPWQLANVLVDLAAQETAMGRGAEALQALAESTEIGEQIGRLPGRSFRLAVAAFVHLVRGENALSISALGAYDAHPAGASEWARPGIGGGYVSWLAQGVEATRARLDPTEVDAATAAARHKSLDELIDELIIQPANAAA
jgi:predicted ATPase/DNA-binding SARP family transcriptional activator/class 3 adenylate cyclase